LPYDKVASRRRRRQIAGEIAVVSGGGFARSSAGIRPKGRAARGQGGEYAARRAIADRLDTLDIQIARTQRTLAGSRGQSKFRRRDTAARTRLALLKKTRRDAGKIARTGADWIFKREMINAVIGAASAQYLS